MNAREKELLARHCLLHLEEISTIWHRKEWEKLAAVVEYAQQGIPVKMNKTDPFMYRKLCVGLCEYHICGYDGFDLACVEALANGTPKANSFGSQVRASMPPASDATDGPPTKPNS